MIQELVRIETTMNNLQSLRKKHPKLDGTFLTISVGDDNFPISG